MTSRERVRRAILFQGPDRVPCRLPDKQPDDLLWLWFPKPPHRQDWTDLGNGHEANIDCWGVTRTRVIGTNLDHGERSTYPIPDISKQAECKFPDLNAPEYFEGVRKQIAANNAKDDPKYLLGVMPFSSLNEGIHNITGLDNMFMAYYECPDDLKVLIARLAAAQRESIRRLADIGCDGVMGYDDWGLQDRLMVSKELFEEFFLPHYRKNWGLAHELGMEVWLHSCGYILPLLPTMAEAGLNVIQMDQQENIGLDALNEAVGGKLAFWCPVDIQKTMVEGSVEDIRAYVKHMIETLGGHNGGLVAQAYPSPDACGHTPEKVAAMCEAFREYGVYEKKA